MDLFKQDQVGEFFESRLNIGLRRLQGIKGMQPGLKVDSLILASSFYASKK